MDAEQTLRECARWKILALLARLLPDGAPEGVIAADLVDAGMAISDTQLRAQLAYLRDRDLIIGRQHRGGDSWALTWYGIDLVEYTTDCQPGIARAAGGVSDAVRERYVIRWRLMRCLYLAGGLPTAEGICARHLADMGYASDPHTVRRQLDYLERRSMVEIVDRAATHWLARLTRPGTDVVEYSVDCRPGIARPPKLRSE
ncbi:MAG: hypothetical protein JNM98_06140 [Rhodocyclaceae bacterium]|nr:hypothetical protein [Rhodocyclaceae bacterium]